MSSLVVITGCSGGGKSSLLDELSARGYPTVAEPGRRLVRQQLAGDGPLLPWLDPAGFARRVGELAAADLAAAEPGWTFFDRGLVDAAIAWTHTTGQAWPQPLSSYHRRVFLAPPWPELYRTDLERRHSFDDALAEYRRLVPGYRGLGYLLVELPRLTIAERADFVLAMLAKTPWDDPSDGVR
jgi:predicted ATPase